MSKPRPSYVARVERDLIEVLSHPLPHVVVCLKGSSSAAVSWVLKVSAGLGCLQGREFYFQLDFSSSYPILPPSLRSLSYLPHQSVDAESGHVCLQMLRHSLQGSAATAAGGGEARRYLEWSPAYSALTVLMHLQDFFLDQYLDVSASAVSRCLVSVAAFEANILPGLGVVELEYRSVKFTVPSVKVVSTQKDSLAQTPAASSATASVVPSPSRSGTTASQSKSASVSGGAGVCAAVASVKPSAGESDVPVDTAEGVKEEVWVTVRKAKAVAKPPMSKHFHRSKPNASHSTTPASPAPPAPVLVSVAVSVAASSLPVSNKFSVLSESVRGVSVTAQATQKSPGSQQVPLSGPAVPMSQMSASAKRRLKRKEAGAQPAAPAPAPSTFPAAPLSSIPIVSVNRTAPVSTAGADRAATVPKTQGGPGVAVVSSSWSTIPNKAEQVKVVQSTHTLNAVETRPRSLPQLSGVWAMLAKTLPLNVVVMDVNHRQELDVGGAEMNVSVSEELCRHGALFSRLSNHTVQYVMMFLEPSSIARAMSTCKLLQAVCVENHVWRPLVQRYYPGCSALPSNISGQCGVDGGMHAVSWKDIFQLEANGVRYEELQCFYSKKSVEEDVLGIPLHYTINPRTSQVDYIYSSMDTVGYSSYESGLRKTVWGESFNGFLPLYFTESHFKRALPVLQQCIRKMALVMSSAVDAGGMRPSGSQPFTPLLVLDVLPRLMNTMVLMLVDRGVEELDKALHGYCQLHRLFVALVDEYPKLRAEIRRRLTNFVHKAECRDKSHCPNLGELVPLLTVCEEVGWLDVVGPLMQESFSRSVLWLCRDIPKLAELATSVSVVGSGPDRPDGGRRGGGRSSQCTAADLTEEVLEDIFKASDVRQRLYSFHCSFLRMVAHPRGARLSEIASKYDKTLGMPPRHMKTQLARMLQAASECKTWSQHFQSVCLAEVGVERLKAMWLQSMRSSLTKGYHSLNTDFGKIQSRGVSKILMRGQSFPRVVLCIDTSGSMEAGLMDEATGEITSRLDYVKAELQTIFREKLTHREQFTVIRFAHVTESWSQGLVQATGANLKAAAEYVDSWLAGGGTNLVQALEVCLRTPDVQVVHLLSDGEVSEQDAVQSLQLVRGHPQVQIHTTAFFAPPSGQQLLQAIADCSHGTFLNVVVDSDEEQGN